MKKSKRNIIHLIFSILLGAVFGFSEAYIFADNIDQALSNNLYGSRLIFILDYVFYTALAFYINIIFHELGHLFFGKLSGFEFVLFRIGSISLVKENGKFKIKRFNIPGTLGQALMSPKGDFYNFKYKLYNYGGVIVNGLLLIGGILLATNTMSIKIRIFSILVSLFGTFAVLTNGIAFEGGYNNDAANVKAMNNSEEARLFYYILLKLSKFYIEGKNINNIEDNLLEKIKNHPKTRGDLYLLLGDYYLSIGERELSKENYYRAMEMDFYSGDFQKYSIIDSLIYLNIIDNNLEEAERLASKDYKKIKKSVLSKMLNSYGTDYAIERLVNKNNEKANKIKEKFNKKKKNYALKTLVVEVEKQIEEVDRKFNSINC